MAYTTNEKSTGLDVLTTLASGDLHIVGDVSDSGRAKAITEDNLEITIANSTNFIDELTENATFITQINTIAPSPLTTKGDLFTYSTVADRLPVGTDGQVLAADSAETTGLKWVNIASGGGGGTKLAIDTTAFSHTGDTNETTMFTIPIPIGTLSTNNAIRFYVPGNIIGNSANVTLKAKYGSSTVTTIIDTSGTTGDYVFSGYIIADASASAQTSSATLTKEGNVVISTDGTDSAENSNTALDLVVTMQLASAGGTVSAKGIVVEEIRSSVVIPETVVYTSNDTWTKADYPGLKYAVVEVVGGGGGGHSVTGGGNSAGGGGGGGGYSKKTIDAGTLGSTETVTVGTGGAASSNGNTSSFGAHASATGGTAGQEGPANGGDGGVGSGGDVNVVGGGGNFGVRVAASGAWGGAGGSSVLGGGGGGVAGGGGVDGTAGQEFGGGGSGAASSSSSTSTGGAGADGVVIVTHYY